MTLSKLTHLDANGRLTMVDVGEKTVSARRAIALGSLFAGETALELLRKGELAKGDAWSATRVAAILAAKRTSDLIPLTHPLRLDAVHVHLFPWGKSRVGALVEALAHDRTGVEMEAMTGVSVALLNLYDMVKAVSKGAVIEGVRLLAKSGGKSGSWLAAGVTEGRVEKLALSESKGTPKTPVDSAVVRSDHGLEGDAHAGDWHRQVSLLGVESIAKMKNKGLDVDFGSFAENVAVSGITLFELPLGTLLFCGSGVILEVSQIGKECHSRCAVYHRAGDCVMPREGIFAKVLSGGAVKSGDPVLAVRIEEPRAPEAPSGFPQT